MTCSTCGRDNPAHLTFCQECGQRLGPRIAPPTPPIGLGAQDPYPSAASARATNLGGVAPAQPPNFKDGVFMAPPPAAASGERRCKICDTVNGPNLRYCTSCGSTLEPAPAPAAAPAPSPSPFGAGTVAMNQQPAPAPAPEIAPMRVVALGDNVAAKTAVDPKMCPRCRGVVDPGAQFCKFCGNSLSEAASALLAHERLELPRAPGGGTPGGGGSNGSAVPKPVAASAVPAPKPIAASAAPIPSPSPIAAAKPIATGAAALAAIPPRGGSVQPAPMEAKAPAIAPSPPLGSPAPAPSPQPPAVTKQRGRLVVIAKSGADGPNYPFGDLFDVGRNEGNVVVPEDPYLSPRHVRILWNNGKLILRDLGSTNGVYLRLAASRDTSQRRGDGAEIAIPLNDQDMILVGQQVLRFDVLREGEGGLGPAQEHGTLLFGSPAAPRYARLTQRTVEGIARDVYHLRKTETVLGRESGDVVFTEDPFLSRRHAAIRVLSRDGEPKFALVDLGSSNGTFIKLRTDVELAPGDHFRVGQQLFRVDFDGANG